MLNVCNGNALDVHKMKCLPQIQTERDEHILS